MGRTIAIAGDSPQFLITERRLGHTAEVSHPIVGGPVGRDWQLENWFGVMVRKQVKYGAVTDQLNIRWEFLFQRGDSFGGVFALAGHVIHCHTRIKQSSKGGDA